MSQEMRVRHDPEFHSTGRHGTWAVCSCGWESGSYSVVVGAVLAHGAHLSELGGPT